MNPEVLKDFIAHDLLHMDEIDANDDLFSHGLDSLSLMRLIVFIEETFHVEIKAEEVVVNNFKNLETIMDLLEGKV